MYKGLCKKTLSLKSFLNKNISINTNEEHSYFIKLESGGLLNFEIKQKGIDLVILIYNSKNKLIDSFDSPTGNDGIEICKILPNENGNFKVKITQLKDTNTETLIFDSSKQIGKYEITKVEVLSKKEYIKKVLEEKLAKEKIINWFKTNALVLNKIEPKTENDYADLMPLKNSLKNVSYIG